MTSLDVHAVKSRFGTPRGLDIHPLEAFEFAVADQWALRAATDAGDPGRAEWCAMMGCGCFPRRL